MSHFAMKTFASSYASAKVCMILLRHFPIWSIAPPGAIFFMVSFTASLNLPLFSRSRKERSRIDRYAFDLCGIAVMGEIISSVGGLLLILSHSTTRACLVRTFSLISSAKCSIASGVNAN